MTEEEINIDEPSCPSPIEELKALINEQRDVILKQNESIKALETRVADFERKATAVQTAPVQEPAVPEPDPQDVAYRAMLREMGIDKEE